MADIQRDNDQSSSVDLENVRDTFKLKTTESELDDPDNKVYNGSCHCKHITYTARLNFKTNNPARCNCTICHKSSQTGIRPRNPTEDFKLITPPMIEPLEPLPAEGSKLGNLLKTIQADPDVGVYKYGAMSHIFCKKCGVKVAVCGWIEALKTDMLTVILPTLDGEEVDFSELTKPGKLQYWDMRHDNWTGGPKDSPWQPGMW